MRAGRVRGRSIATRVTIVTAILLTAAVIIIGVVSLAGVYSVVAGEDLSRLASLRQLLGAGIDARLGLLTRVLEPVAKYDLLEPRAGETLSQSLIRNSQTGVEYFDQVLLVDPAGRVVAATVSAAATSMAGEPWFRGAAAAGAPRFATTASEGLLWVVHPVDDAPAPGLLLLARTRAGVLRAVLDDVVPAGTRRMALVIGDDGSVVRMAASGARPDTEALTFVPASGRGSGEVRCGDGTTGFAGFYQQVTSAPELGWRVAVLEPEGLSADAARQALVPAMLSTALAWVLGMAGVVAFSRSAVAPLSAFERRAREAAAGGRVRPLVLERDDELGRLTEAFNALGVRLDSLQSMSELLGSASKTDEALDAVLSATTSLLGTSEAAILLAEEDASRLSLARGHGLAEPDAEFHLPLDEPSPVVLAFAERRVVPLAAATPVREHPVLRLFGAGEDRSGIAVPLVSGDTALGVIVALAPGRHPLTEAQVETLRAFSAHAAVALGTSRSFEHERESRSRAEALQGVAEIVSGARNAATALDEVAAIARRLFGMSHSAYALDDRDEFGIRLPGDPREDEDLLDLWKRSAEESGGGRTFEPVVAAGPSGGEDGSGPRSTREGRTLLIPLVRGDVVRGVLALWGTTRELGTSDLAVAEALSHQVSLALDNSALLEEARSRAANLETIFRISQTVSSSLQLSDVLNRVLEVVRAILTADVVVLMSHDPERRALVTTMARGTATSALRDFSAIPGEDLPGRVFETRTPELYADLSEVDSALAQAAVADGLRSLLAVPLLARGRAIGVLLVYDRRASAFSTKQVELLSTFASQAALAIDTASTYGREHLVATVLQRSILPESLPDLAGLELDSFYLPAGPEGEIGGDFYDIFARADGTVAVALGDVCGKGVNAATKTSVIKYTMRGLIAAGMEPAQVLQELNRILAAGGSVSDIVSVWLGFINAERDSLTFSDGGHPPALLRVSGKPRFRRLASTGPLLGAIEDALYEQETVPLAPGDLLLAYTDGVSELRRQGMFFGEGRVRRAITHAESASWAIESLLESITAFSGGRMRDDAAALAIRITDVTEPTRE